MTTPPRSAAPLKTSTLAPWLPVLPAWLTLIALCLTPSTACRPRLVVIPAVREIKFLSRGQTITATNSDLYLVPPARMKEILDRLSEAKP